MWALLKTRRWIAFTVLVIVAIAAFGLLSRWQWSRADERRAERTELAAELAATPMSAEQALNSPREWAPVRLTGTYDAERTVLVRQRPLNGANGFWVATPLITDSGTSIWINRGWLPVTGSATAVQSAPSPPSGTVTVTGHLRAAESTPSPAPQDLPPGQVPALDPSALGLVGDSATSQAARFYVELISSQPAEPDLTPIPLPEIDEGRNISYAVQWLLFAAVAIAGWFFFLRREAREDADTEHQEAPWTSA